MFPPAAYKLSCGTPSWENMNIEYFCNSFMFVSYFVPSFIGAKMILWWVDFIANDIRVRLINIYVRTAELSWREAWAASWQTNKMACAPSEDSDQPGHPPSLIRVFAVRLKKARILSYPLSAQRRLWSDLHNKQFVSWIYLYAITAAAENTLIWKGNTFLTCVFFKSKTNRTSVQTDCIILVFSK